MPPDLQNNWWEKITKISITILRDKGNVIQKSYKPSIGKLKILRHILNRTRKLFSSRRAEKLRALETCFLSSVNLNMQTGCHFVLLRNITLSSPVLKGESGGRPPCTRSEPLHPTFLQPVDCTSTGLTSSFVRW